MTTVSRNNFIKFSSNFYGEILLSESLNEAFHTGKLSISQRRGIISLKPKDENNLMVLSNWRPITLLNVDYKILDKAIVKRNRTEAAKIGSLGSNGRRKRMMYRPKREAFE